MNYPNAGSRQIPNTRTVPAVVPRQNPQAPNALPFTPDKPTPEGRTTEKSRVVNYVVLEGYLGQDPEQKQTPSGIPLVQFSLATQEPYKDNAGSWQKKAQWHRIVAWDQVAQLAASLRKGSYVRVEGRLTTRHWVDQHNQRRTEIQVVAKAFRFFARGASSAKTGDLNYSVSPISKAPISASATPQPIRRSA